MLPQGVAIRWLTEGKCNDRKFSCIDDCNRLSTLYSYLLLLLIIIISYDFEMCPSLLSAAAGCKPARFFRLCAFGLSILYSFDLRFFYLPKVIRTLKCVDYILEDVILKCLWVIQRTHLASSFSMLFCTLVY